MRAITLLYHDVVEDGKFATSGFAGAAADSYKMESAQFARHLCAIEKVCGDPPVGIYDCLAGSSGGRPLLLTFDDGGASAYYSIAPQLEERGWRGHFFITTDFIGLPAFVSEGQIRELHERGHIIGSHSCSHPARMSYCHWEQMLDEWSGSIARLAEIIGAPVRVASLPGGYYSPRVAEMAARAGIKALFTSEPTSKCHQVGDCLVLGRFTLRRWAEPRLAAALAAGRLLPRLHQSLYWKVKKIAKSTGGELYLKAREILLN